MAVEIAEKSSKTRLRLHEHPGWSAAVDSAKVSEISNSRRAVRLSLAMSADMWLCGRNLPLSTCSMHACKLTAAPSSPSP